MPAPACPNRPVAPVAPVAPLGPVGPVAPVSPVQSAAVHRLSWLMSSLSGPVVLSQFPLPLRSQHAVPSFLFGPAAPAALYTLSLHDALPISVGPVSP